MYADLEKSENTQLDAIQWYRRYKNLCYKKKAMHDLEYASLVLDIVLGFVCVNLSLLHYFNVGKDFEKKTGLIGLITGIVCFIITLVYICYNGDVFNNGVAYEDYASERVLKLFPNGAICKGNIHVYEGEKDVDAKYIKYKDLGKKQYNYDGKYYKITKNTGGSVCVGLVNSESCLSGGCTYTFYPAYTSNENKDLYDRWLTTLILSIIIDICCIGLSVFGFLLFKSSKGDSGGEKTVPIN